jgi:GTPase SAR1 family protein
MRYHSFRVRNYKGVRDTTIVLPYGPSSASILIGLNESGKTTLLEAIYSFSPDEESQPLFDKDTLLPNDTAKIPRDQLFSFTDDISITATVEFLPGEKEEICNQIGRLIGGKVDISTVPDSFTVKDWTRYVNSQKTRRTVEWALNLMRVKTGRQQKWRPYTAAEWQRIWTTLRKSLPSIAYSPTFLGNYILDVEIAFA